MDEHTTMRARARTVAALGAALFAFAAWAPWWVFAGFSAPGAPAATAATNFSPGGAPTLPLLEFLIVPSATSFVWSALTVLGLLLAPLLWWRPVPLVSRLVLAAYGLWALVVSIISVSVFVVLTQGEYAPAATCTGACPARSSSPAYGLWLSLAALLVAWVGFVLLVLRGGASPSPQAGQAATAAGTQGAQRRAGVGLLTAGVLLWAYGFLVTAWATLNCTQTPLLFGTCTGASASAALQSGLDNSASVVDPLAGRYAIALLLAAGAALILASLALRAAARAQRVWIALWLLAAIGFAVLGDYGVSVIVARPTDVGLAAGAWSGGQGVVITFLALLLGVAGLATLWITQALRGQRR